MSTAHQSQRNATYSVVIRSRRPGISEGERRRRTPRRCAFSIIRWGFRLLTLLRCSATLMRAFRHDVHAPAVRRSARRGSKASFTDMRHHPCTKPLRSSERKQSCQHPCPYGTPHVCRRRYHSHAGGVLEPPSSVCARCAAPPERLNKPAEPRQEHDGHPASRHVSDAMIRAVRAVTPAFRCPLYEHAEVDVQRGRRSSRHRYNRVILFRARTQVW